MIKKIAYFCALVFFPFSCLSNDLVGSWNVDIDRTVGFNEQYLGHSDLALQLLKCAGENERLTLGKNKIFHVVDGHYCEFKGKRARIDGVYSSYSYRLLYSTGRELVLLKSDGSGAEAVQTINWINPNLFWVDEIYDSDTQQEMRYFYYREE